jgi:hypothetical protein
MVHRITPFQQPHDGASAEQAYFNNDSLHPLPMEVWRNIGEFVATGATPLQAAAEAIELGKVNEFFHAFSHEPAIDEVIERGAKSKWTEVKALDGFNPVTITYDHWGHLVSRQKKGGARM